MTGPRLKSIVIENFRSLRGKVVIPLDAQVVLIHGTNGMGKTSVLSALELGLAGKIAHLAADGDGYRRYLTTLDTGGGSIALTTTQPVAEDGRIDGALEFSDNRFTPTALLEPANARFFAERCYLPQATLGRLLEIYDDQKVGSTSPLTLFVKELLGLDPLDALVDGLEPAFHVARIRRIAPDHRRLEALQSSLKQDIAKSDRLIEEASATAEQRLTDLNAKLAGLAGEAPPHLVTESTDLAALRKDFSETYDQDRKLAELTSARSELRGLNERWRAVPSEDASRDQAGKQRNDQLATQAFADWRSGIGASLDRAIGQAQTEFSDIPSLDDGPEKSREEALRRAEGEQARTNTLLKTHTSAAERVTTLQAIVERATTKIDELNKDLAGAAKDAKSLANALAGVVPHIDGEACPVCDRDFSEKGVVPLSAHVAAKIASLTGEAGRLQALTAERAEESRRLADAKSELLTAGNGQLSSEEFADLSMRQTSMSDLVRTLRECEKTAAEGTQLLAASVAARNTLVLARRRDQLSVSMVPEIEAAIQATLGREAANFPDLETALATGIGRLEESIAAAERTATLRIETLSAIDLRIRDLDQIAQLRKQRKASGKRFQDADKALAKIETTRTQAKKLSAAADGVRSGIVTKVFSTSLNKVWRDLFVRLAPSEQFVPAFRLPPSQGGKVEAVLETLHRNGQASGSPGAMLSQGNLNTAALTLFLALHLSVPVRMPWLVLDDPVQSMDDVHIAQFAALLRTLSKGMGRQIVIAVHERALFDYLALELSPAFAGDSLITVEIGRNFDGDAVAIPRVLGFEDDQVIAA